MKRQITTDNAPNAIGPYSQAIAANGLVFVSGQLGIDAATGIAGDVAGQTHAALRNVQAVLAAAGVGMDAIVKTTVFLHDMQDFTAMNEAYAAFFTPPYPARACVQAVLPREGAKVEIECIAIVKED